MPFIIMDLGQGDFEISQIYVNYMPSSNVLFFTAQVKSYPKGVTTNSDSGVESYEPYYPIFAVLQEMGLSLHLHGEGLGQARVRNLHL